MSAAQLVTMYVHALCREKFPDEGRLLASGHPATVGEAMASTMLNGSWADVFDHKGHGSHKYIPADRLTEDLGEKKGAGVYGYWKMYDDSYVLLTCKGPLAYWSGQEDDKAEWGK